MLNLNARRETRIPRANLAAAATMVGTMFIISNAWSVPVTCISGDHDWGDAPDVYGTLAASDGARHCDNNPSLFLGAVVDLEADGLPSVLADGDDLSASDDEDGVVFTSALLPTALATLDVTASAAGFLDAWFDFDGDGSWGDAGEQIFASIPLAAGVNSLSFMIPGTALLGDTYTRFRFSDVGGLSFTGGTPTGEVEDYLVTVGEVPLPSTLALFALGLLAMRRRITP